MIETILYGAVGALLVLGLLALGFFMGWKGCEAQERRRRQGPAEEADEGERRELREQQRAFEGMLSYNADVAYGLTDGLAALMGTRGIEG